MTTTAVGPVLLEVRDLVLAGDRLLDFHVAAGELVSVSGEHTSDLLWAIAGLGDPGGETITIDGEAVANQVQALAAGVALIPQGGAVASFLTAYENVMLPLTHRSDDRGHRSEDLTAAARRALELVGLLDSADHLVEELSGGQQQRVAIARALAARPRLLLADQATTDLDPGNRARVMRLMRDLAMTGAGVLLASDDPAVVESCDRTLTLP